MAKGKSDVFNRLVVLLGMRMSETLLCVHDIVAHIPVGADFTRAEVLMGMYRVYATRTIDRALRLMEAHGILTCKTPPKGGPRGGAVYQMNPQSQWHAYTASVVEQRTDRYHLAPVYRRRAPVARTAGHLTTSAHSRA